MDGRRQEVAGGWKQRRPRPALVLAATITASSLPFIDGSVVNVAGPTVS